MHTKSPDERTFWTDWRLAIVLALLLLGTYHLNRDFPWAEDDLNLYLAAAICRDGSFTLTPEDMPAQFHWEAQSNGRRLPVEIAWVDSEVDSLLQAGALRMTGQIDVLVPTRFAGRYGNCFGMGPAMSAVPIALAAHQVVGPLNRRPDWLFALGKLVASSYVATSAALVYLICRLFTRRAFSLVIAVAYGIGTCAWSVSSQSLWQHAPNQFFLSLGCYALFRRVPNKAWAALCGASFGAAVLCRPTSAVAVLVAAGYLLLYHRGALISFLAGGLPLAAALIVYNLFLYGKPLYFGQVLIPTGALTSTGSSEMWQTPLWLGAMGKLCSPSRGALVFSPFLIFIVWGGVLAWRDPVYRPLRILPLMVLPIWLVDFRYWDWWAGWSFAYRHLIDTVMLLILLLIPVMPVLARSRLWTTIFTGSMLFSIGVQLLGAFAYDTVGWNGRQGFRLRQVDHPENSHIVLETAAFSEDWPPAGYDIEPVKMNIDLVEFRPRLWSWRDSALVYYATHFRESRQRRQNLMAYRVRPVPVRQAETYVNLANAYLELANSQQAERLYRLALELEPGYLDAVLGQARLAASRDDTTSGISILEQVGPENRTELRWLVTLALLQQADGRHDAALASMRRAREQSAIFARAVFQEQLSIWRKQVEPTLPAPRRQLLAEFATELSPDWFFRYQSRPAEAAIVTPN
jgi:hypothetical protein